MNNYRILEETGITGFNLDRLNYWRNLTIGDQERLYLYFAGTEEPLIFTGTNAKHILQCLKGSFRDITNRYALNNHHKIEN